MTTTVDEPDPGVPLTTHPHTHTVNRTNNQDAIGGWVNTGGYEDWAVVPLQDTLEVMYVESQTGLRPPASNLTQLQNFMLINVRYLPTNLRDGIINTIDLAVELEAYGNYSSLYSQGSKYDVLLLPPSLPNVSNPTLRMDIDVSPPTYFERQSTSLPAAVVTKPSVTVVKGPSYYVGVQGGCCVCCQVTRTRMR